MISEESRDTEDWSNDAGNSDYFFDDILMYRMSIDRDEMNVNLVLVDFEEKYLWLYWDLCYLAAVFST